MIAVMEIIESIAIILACWAAIAGIDAWKREFIGKRRIELAEEILEAFFEVRDAISYIRSPFSTSEEGKSRKRRDHEQQDESAILDQAYVAIERYQKKGESFNKFDTLKYRAMASFGQGIEPAFKKPRQAINRVMVSARMLGSTYWQNQGRVNMDEKKFENHLEGMRKHEGRFWDHGDEDDEIRAILDSALSEIETYTKPCFEETTTIYTFLTRNLIFWRVRKS